MPKWNEWYNSLPAHTRASMKNQPLWHDKDVALFVSIALIVGFVIGWSV